MIRFLRMARARRFWRAYQVDLLLAFISFAGALAIRLPNFMLVPRYTDEGLEVLWALDIARGRQLPLTAVDAYYGPLFSYLVAVILRIFGSNIILPRLMTTIFGALTVAATYGLGRVMWNRRAGLIAAALAATSPELILGSHMGWSNSLTPFFCTVTAIALYAGVAKKRTGLLVLSGLLAALALQAHPLSIVGLVGMLAWFLLRRDTSWLKRKSSYAALALFLVGYSPMIIANLGPVQPMLIVAESRTYAFAPTLAPGEYATRIGGLFQHIAVMLGGGIEGTAFGSGLPQFVAAGLLLAGLALAWQRGNGLLAAVFLSTITLLPIIVTSFGGASDRYIAFLAPLGYAAIGGLIAEILSRLGAANPAAAARPRIVRAGAMALTTITLLAVVVYPVFVLLDYNEQALRSGETNLDFFRLTDVLKSVGACGNDLFVLDRPFPGQSHTQAYFTATSIQYVLDLAGCGHSSLRNPEIIAHLSQRGGLGWLIMPAPYVPNYTHAFDLEPVTTIVAYANADPGPFVLYRVKPLP